MAAPAVSASASLFDLGRSVESGHVGLSNRAGTQMSTPITRDEKRSSESRAPLVRVVASPEPSRWNVVMRKLKGAKIKEDWAHEIDQAIRQKRRDEPLAGYPMLAEFLGSDERWLIFRRFSHLQARLLLEKQDEMRQIEEELQDMDFADKEETPLEFDEERRRLPCQGNLFTRHRRKNDEAKARAEFFERAQRVYKEYAELLNAANQLAKLDKPADYERKSVEKYISTAKPVVEREANWIGWKKDLVTLRKEREHAFFDAIVETVVNRVKNSDSAEEDTNKTTDKKMQRWLEKNASAGEVARWIHMIFLSVLVPGLFVIPIYALLIVQHHIGQSIGVLIAFTIAFTCLLAVGTPAKAHEVWGSAAAYLAVLVVFLGSVSHSKSGGSK